ncbi:MAG: hypothetical protein GY705_04815 [Bacteroidetes bacterium]|nr:hypothetical protein [Bacteroidota bacterium]
MPALRSTDWYAVVFEEVLGNSSCKLAINEGWLKRKEYAVGAVADMNLPEQGINGPFLITSIKHLLPQKKPEDKNAEDDYEYRPVTGIFVHESANVLTLSFESGESLGVTHQHPIYSVTAGGWRLAGELEVGEKVLTKSGEETVTESEKKQGAETVYNLEVQALHNFLVGESGVVVHNECMGLKLKLFFGKWTPKKQPGTNWVEFIEESGELTLSHEINQLENLGSKLQRKMIGLEKSPYNGAAFPGIDGFLDDGRALSLKAAENYSAAKNRLRDMCTKANNLNGGTVQDHEVLKDIFSDGIEGMISPKEGFTLSKLELKNAWNSVLGNNQINSDIVKVLYVEGSDGWLKWTRTHGWTDIIN